MAEPGSLDQLPGIPGALFILVRSPKLRWSTGVTAKTKLTSTKHKVTARQPEVMAKNSRQNSQTHGNTKQTHRKSNSTPGITNSTDSRRKDYPKNKERGMRERETFKTGMFKTGNLQEWKLRLL